MRIAILVVLAAVAVWLAVDWLVTTDAERVEMEVEHLLEVARHGGEDAVQEILGALADDYRGAYSKDMIERYLRMALVADKPEEITTGSPDFVPKGDEILIPLLRVDVRTKSLQGTALLRITFAKRGDRFRIVNVEHWQSGR
ncbi:MAG TPA: hypothetical protein VFY93_10705 [Planctomycetota bacterium]|nr:hypothetical protein [Planctomycetota bacterium]